MDQDKDLVFGSALSCVLFGLGIYSYQSSMRVREQAERFEAQRVYSPSEIRDIVQFNDPLVHSIFKRKGDGDQLISQQILIRGVIENGECLNSIVSKTPERLVMRVNYDLNYYSLSSKYNVFQQKRMENDFYLTRKELSKNVVSRIQPTITIQNGGVACQAFLHKDFDNIDLQCFDHQVSVSHDKNAHILMRAWNKIGGVFAGLFGVLFQKDLRNLFCFKVQVDSCEIGIKNGGILCFFGDLVYNRQKNEMSMQNPIRLMKNKMEWLSKLKRSADSKYISSLFCWLFSISLTSVSFVLLSRILDTRNYITFFGYQINIPNKLIFIVRRVAQLFAKPSFNLKQAPLGDENKLLEAKYINPREALECTICYHRCRSVVLRPCLHCSMCLHCFQALTKKECPFCKTAITNKALIYSQDQNS